MGFAVVHMMKIGKGGVRGIQSHNQREKDPLTNPDIDKSRTKDNYDVLHDEPISYHKEIKERIEQYATATKTVRKDAVVLCNFVVTSDEKTMKAMSPERQREFFEDSTRFFAKRYGAENLVNATVHMDERTPHMHLGVVPINADGRLAAKTLFDKKEMSALQTDFAREVGSKYGLERGKEGSERTHLSEQQFKAETARQEAEKIRQDIQPLQEKENALQGKIAALEHELRGKVLTLKQLNEIQPQKALGGGVKNITVEDVENLKRTAYGYIKAVERVNTLTEDCNRLQKRADYSIAERQELASAKLQLNKLEKAFAKLPQEVQRELLTDTINREISRGR